MCPPAHQARAPARQAWQASHPHCSPHFHWEAADQHSRSDLLQAIRKLLSDEAHSAPCLSTGSKPPNPPVLHVFMLPPSLQTCASCLLILCTVRGVVFLSSSTTPATAPSASATPPASASSHGVRSASSQQRAAGPRPQHGDPPTQQGIPPSKASWATAVRSLLSGIYSTGKPSMLQPQHGLCRGATLLSAWPAQQRRLPPAQRHTRALAGAMHHRTGACCNRRWRPAVLIEGAAVAVAPVFPGDSLRRSCALPEPQVVGYLARQEPAVWLNVHCANDLTCLLPHILHLQPCSHEYCVENAAWQA